MICFVINLINISTRNFEVVRNYKLDRQILTPLCTLSFWFPTRVKMSSTAAVSDNVLKPKKRAPATHPTYKVMMEAAITALSGTGSARSGSSRQMILKYIKEHYTVNDSCDMFLRTALVKGVACGTLVQITGKGASGSFKLPKVEKKATAKEKQAPEKVKKAPTTTAKMVVKTASKAKKPASTSSKAVKPAKTASKAKPTASKTKAAAKKPVVAKKAAVKAKKPTAKKSATPMKKRTRATASKKTAAKK